ncbi:MAG TPA: VOC family protein [Tepidisphaeraceae bacterium]|jgi:glyoxylase I family protein
MGIQGFHHVAIRVQDFEAAIAFYRDGLGFPERVRWSDGQKMIALLDTGGGDYIEILSNGKPPPLDEGAWSHLALRTDDCDAAFARALAAGASPTIAPKEMPIRSHGKSIRVRLAFCRGPNGEIIEFFQNSET